MKQEENGSKHVFQPLPLCYYVVLAAQLASCSVVLVNNGTLLLHGVSLGTAQCRTIPEPLPPGASATCTVRALGIVRLKSNTITGIHR